MGKKTVYLRVKASMHNFYSGFFAVATKELLHIVRDRLTLALLISVPVIQIILFGFAIDLHPKQLPTALLAYENDNFVNRAVNELEKIDYFHVVTRTNQPAEAERLLAESKVQFILALPPNFALQTIAGDQPQVKLIADGTDPVASIVATQAAQAHYASANISTIASPNKTNLPIALIVESRYNPEGSSRRYIVLGLLGVVLTLTLVLLGALSMVRERERGSLETLYLLPIPRIAIILGKMTPYFILGCLLFILLLFACTWLLALPLHGFSISLVMTVLLFIAANLVFGFLVSLIVSNQMQAMQLSIFFYLPSMLLSGFMFPFYGMPQWAQYIGEALPLTHFLRVIRGALLKGLNDTSILTLAWPIVVFLLLAIGLTSLISSKTSQ